MLKIRFREPGESLTHALLMWAVASGLVYAAALLLEHVFGGGAGASILFADNTLLTSTLITRESMRVLENNLTTVKCVNRQYDSKFGVEGAKIGQIVNARKPIRVVGRTGQAASIEPITETSVPVPLTTQAGVDLEVSQADLLLKIDDFGDRILKPCVANIANRMDADTAAIAQQFWENVGTPATTPNALLTYLLAGVALDNNLAPQDNERHLILTPLSQAYIVDALKGLFQQSSKIAEQYVEGKMGRAIGFSWYMDQNLPTQTVGPQGGMPLVNGAGQSGNSLITDGWTAAAASRLVTGDRFTIAGVYQVNAQSRVSNGNLQEFVVTAPASSDGSGNLTVYFNPPLVASGQYQTVDSLPADNAAITVVGAANAVSPTNIAFHRDAMTIVTADLPLPRGVDMAGRLSDKQLGMSISFVRAYDVFSGQLISRLDVLYGCALLRGELGTVIYSGG
jgi:hypothetical protein